MEVQNAQFSVGGGQSHKTVKLDLMPEEIQPFYDDNLKELEGYLTVKQITNALKIGRHTVYKWMHEYNPPLPHMRFGYSTIRIHSKDLQNWIYSQFYTRK